MRKHSRKPLRIELHRLKFHFSGRKIKRLRFENLSIDEKILVSEAIFSEIHATRGDAYETQIKVLEDWGLMCMHPQHMRLYSGTISSPLPLPDHKWYRCECCGSSCVNEIFMSENNTRKCL